MMVAACHDRVNEHDNKLTGVWSAGVSPAQWVSFEYDALGRRVMTAGLPTPGAVRYYLSSGQNEVAEHNGQGQRVRYYVHGPTYIDERVVMHNDPVGGGAPTTGSDYIYLLKDLYTVAGLADERGWPVERYDYDAYGKGHMERVAILPWAADFDGDGDVDQNDLTVFLDAYGGSGQAPNGPRGWRADLDGDGDVDGSDYVLFADAYNGAANPPRPPSPTVSVGSMGLTTSSMVVSRVGNPFFFTGRRLDVLDKQDAGTPHHFTDDYAGLTLYEYRARTYDPALGRFGQRDAVARVERDGYASNPQDQYWDGASPYQYAKSSPSLAFDPSGLCCCFDPFYENDGVCRDILPGTICSCIKAIYRFDGKLMSRKVEWISDASAYSNCSKCKKKCFPLLVIVTPLVNLQVNKEIPTPFLPGWTIIESCRCNGLAWIWTCCKLPEPYVEH